MALPASTTPSLPPGSFLNAVDGHRVWWCEGGGAAGLPVLIVHGGPGGSSRSEPGAWFADLPVRWLAMDQRGCGRSTPAGETRRNELPDLVDDMERLRRQLGLERWALVGGSWGARVALAYALRCPERVSGLMLRSPFLATSAETCRYIAGWDTWLGAAGRNWLGPELSRAVRTLYCGGTQSPADGTGLPLGVALNDRRVAQAWSAFDDAQSGAGGVAARASGWTESALPAATPALLASWAVHAHYALQGWGASQGVPRGVLVPRLLPRTPVQLVWGTEDATCDPAAAQALATALTAGGLDVEQSAVPGAGHRMGEPRLASALHRAAHGWIGALRGSGGN